MMSMKPWPSPKVARAWNSEAPSKFGPFSRSARCSNAPRNDSAWSAPKQTARNDKKKFWTSRCRRQKGVIMATLDDLRKLALAHPETIEGSHFHQVAFRVADKPF